MREILFRGKTDRDRWAYGSLILAGSYCCILEDEEVAHPMDYPYLDDDLGTIDGKATPVDPKTIGQFTGLLDKNGKKIFEGDIVKFCSGEIRSVAFDEKYSEFEFSRKDPVENVDGLALCVDHDVCEVIGNIHDNPVTTITHGIIEEVSLVTDPAYQSAMIHDKN